MSDAEPQSNYRFGRFRLCPDRRQLQDVDGNTITLRGKVFDLLWYLVQRRGRLISKAELLEALWPGTVVEENNLNQAVSALRQALGDNAHTPSYVVTIKGRGYQFIGEVSAETAMADSATRGAAPAKRFWPVALTIAVIAAMAMLWIDRDGNVPVAAGSPVIQRFADATLTLATDFPGSHSEPTLSPDGRMMAYVSDASGTSQIWVKNLQRGDPLQLTDGPYPARGPSWSPADDQILFEQGGPDGYSINSVGTLGSPAATMVVNDAYAANYSRHGNAFVFARGRELWIARNDGRDIQPIRGVPASQGFARREPALSPDGELVAFIHADEGPLGNLWIIPSAGGEARQLTGLAAGGGIASAPEWSNDGQEILYSIDAGMNGGQLWRINIESGVATALTAGAGGARDAALSSDGSRLAYTATRTRWMLTRIDPETAQRSTIYVSRSPILLPIAAPGGKQIVFFTRVASGMQLFTIGSNGDNLRQLTFDEAGENALPTWAGDGKSILYYRGKSLHRLSPADGSDTELFADFHWSSRIWLAAHGDRLTYHIVDRPTRSRRTVVRKLSEGLEKDLPVPIEAAQWSADGRTLLGWFRRTGELLLCDVARASCANLQHDGELLLGLFPKWSNDEQEIYYLRSTAGECCTLWRVDLSGETNRRIVDLNNYDGSNSYYGIDANGHIFYNRLDRSTDEIWIADAAKR